MGNITEDALLVLREQWRREQKKLVFTNGIFDLLHSGHVHYLEEARALGDVLVVGINSDTSTRTLKGPLRPLVPERERAYLVSALRCVDYVTIFHRITAEALVERLRPDIYVKGGDYAVQERTPGDTGMLQVDDSRLPEAPIVRRYGGQIVLLPYREGLSTTALLQQIAARFQP